jgi:dihydroorotase
LRSCGKNKLQFASFYYICSIFTAMLLIRSALVVLSGSTYNGKTVDIFIENGKVKRIGAKLKNTENAPELSFPNLHIAPGFVDMHAYIGEPGFEQKETIASACKSAAKGGITQFCVMPNLNPASTTKSQIEFLKQKANGQNARLLPVGALTHNLEGKDLAEVFDMHQAGAVAFSDGYKALPNAGILERALLYTSAFDGLVMVHAEEKSMSKNGVMHEGIVSTQAWVTRYACCCRRDGHCERFIGSRIHKGPTSLSWMFR